MSNYKNKKKHLIKVSQFKALMSPVHMQVRCNAIYWSFDFCNLSELLILLSACVYKEQSLPSVIMTKILTGRHWYTVVLQDNSHINFFSCFISAKHEHRFKRQLFRALNRVIFSLRLGQTVVFQHLFCESASSTAKLSSRSFSSPPSFHLFSATKLLVERDIMTMEAETSWVKFKKRKSFLSFLS